MAKSQLLKILLLAILSTTFTACIFAQNEEQQGDLLIISSEGFRIYDDGNFIGFTSNEQDGLLIQKLDTGAHTISIKKSGYNDFSAVINITAGKTFEFEYNAGMKSKKDKQDDKAIVYIFRPSKMRGKWVNITINVDDRKVAESKLQNKTYLVCYVEPGKHVFWHSLYGSRNEIEIDCKVGVSYYISNVTGPFKLESKEEFEKLKPKLNKQN